MKKIIFALLIIPFLSFSQSECWVAADQKLVFLLPDMSKPHTLPSPLFMPVTGSANPEITWSWSPTAGLIDPSTKIEKANIALNSWRLDTCTLYVTIEPCPMCAGAIIQSRIKKVVYGAQDAKSGAHQSVVNLFDLPLNHKVDVEHGIMEDECGKIISKFFSDKRNK